MNRSPAVEKTANQKKKKKGSEKDDDSCTRAESIRKL